MGINDRQHEDTKTELAKTNWQNCESLKTTRRQTNRTSKLQAKILNRSIS